MINQIIFWFVFYIGGCLIFETIRRNLNPLTEYNILGKILLFPGYLWLIIEEKLK